MRTFPQLTPLAGCVACVAGLPSTDLILRDTLSQSIALLLDLGDFIGLLVKTMVKSI